MYPARGEPGRNGDHRPLEFSDVIIGCRGILHLDDSETCLTRHLRVAGSVRQAHRIIRLAPKAQTAGIDLTIRPSGMGQETRASEIQYAADLAEACPARDARQMGVVAGPERWPQCLANYGRVDLGRPPEDPQASGQPPGPPRVAQKSMLFPCRYDL